MNVIKRDGRLENVQFDKITKRIKYMCKESQVIDPVIVAKEVISRVNSGITTSYLDRLAAEFCISKSVEHLEWGVLASKIIVDDHQKNCVKTFGECCRILYGNTNQVGENVPLISKTVMECAPRYEKLVDSERDFMFDYFGFKTLYRSYLLKTSDGTVIETPQYMWLRVSIGIHGDNPERVKETYDLLSQGYFTHATPTLFNSGTNFNQQSSCFLIGTEDSVDGIFETIKNCAKISKWAGGIGIHVSNIRGKDSYISSTGGKSDGILPMLRTYNEVARYINQGGKRNGSFAIYVEPWHVDIYSFLDAKLNHGDESLRARDLFYGLWVPDLFMERVFEDSVWSLMCPSECPGLSDVWGDEFNVLYRKYEQKGMYKKQVKAKSVWEKIINSQIETGTPYMLYKDACNRKSNQKNIGTIKSSNLCSEIIEYSDNNECAVCNLASIALPKFVENGKFNFAKLIFVTRRVCYNLNQIIDNNFYPIPESQKSNKKHRPIGIGVQGLADTFFKMRYPYDSKEARELNIRIFEAIYYGALQESCELAKSHGPYETYEGSPLSQGIFQFDMWESHQLTLDWDQLRTDIGKYGVRNSLVTALMPTASTSQILGNYEAFEPVTSNWYNRKTLAGEFVVINKHLVQDLIELGLWDNKLKNNLIKYRGSVQKIEGLPEWIKDLYKTVWEIKQKVLVDLSADRGRFVDQSQSLNLFFDEASYSKLTKAHYYGWKNGLKTGSYYIRSKPSIIQDEPDCLNCSS